MTMDLDCCKRVTDIVSCQKLYPWIFAHFPKLPGIPKEQHSDAEEYCTRWKWGLSITDRTDACELLKYREAFDNYKVEDVVWDPNRAERSSDHDFNENTFFNGLTSSPDHVEPIYPNRVVRKFAKIQPIPKNPKCVEVSGLRTWDGEEAKQYKPKYDWVDVFLKGLWKEWMMRSRDKGRRLRGGTCTMCKGLRVKIEQMKEDRIHNDVVHEQYVKLFEKLLAKLEEKLVVIPKGETVHSRDLQKNIDELTAKYEDVVKRLKEKESFRSQLIIVYEMKKKLEVEYYEWLQAIKKEFYSGELAEKDDPIFIELFDQYDRFYTIAQQGPKGDYQEDFTVTGENQDKLIEVRRADVVLKKKINETLFQLYVKYHLNVRGVQGEDVFLKSVFSQSLDTRFSSRGEMVYEKLHRACSYGGQHVQYRHMRHLLATCYEKVVVFINNHEAYTFLLLFWLRKNNHISNEKRFENLVGDTTKFWWVGLGSVNQYVRLFMRYGAPMPPVSTLWLAHADLGLRGDFQRDM
ncbi:hypothetical protein GIB67_009633, partial [Kingdonia uniflora]